MELFDEVDFDEKKTKQHVCETRKQMLPWVEKYRPSKINDIIDQEEVIDVLNNTLKTGNLPNLLFYGQAGTGKTTTIIALCKQLFGENKFKERVLELNASDDRGIETVRSKIMNFAKIIITNRDTKYLCPDYKIIILDEADTMTVTAQSALRKIMEDMSKKTRFCFICNSINKIIQPIISRCVKFKFNHLRKGSIMKLIKKISKKENIDIGTEQLKIIAEQSKGDMRKAITILQNAKYITLTNGYVTNDDIFNVMGKVPETEIRKITNDLINKVSTNKIKKRVHQLINNGYSMTETLQQLNDTIIFNDDIDDNKKSLISVNLDNIMRRIEDGSDIYIQLFLSLLMIRNVIDENNEFRNESFC